MQHHGTSNEPEPSGYRWCPFCNELWSVARFAAICPLCEGLTLAYVGRLTYEEYSRWRRQSPLKRGVDLIETALIDGVRQVSTVFVTARSDQPAYEAIAASITRPLDR